MFHRLRIGASLAVLAVGLVFPSAAAATTVVAQWNMDETFGTTMTDSSGNGNDGTTTDIITSGGGYIFNGDTSKAVVPDSATLNPGAADFSYTVQFQTTVVPASGFDYDMIRKGLSSTDGGEYKMELINVSGKAKAFCLVKDSKRKWTSLRAGNNLADNRMHTITCKKTATSLSLILDGKTVNTKSIALGTVSNTGPVMVGSKAPDDSGPVNDAYNGLMRSATITVEP